MKVQITTYLSQATEAAEPEADSEAVPQDVDNTEAAAFGEGSQDASDECSDVSEYVHHQAARSSSYVDNPGGYGPNGESRSDYNCRTQ